jgi:hypothetical protein
VFFIFAFGFYFERFTVYSNGVSPADVDFVFVTVILEVV